MPTRRRIRCCSAVRAWCVALLAGYATTSSPQVSEAGPAQQTQHIRVAVGAYYDALSAYGKWLYSDKYGWVWVPDAAVVGADFFPYATAGHWTYTDHGWLFVSDWSWGWAPFHYGRWYYGQRGWTWVPGVVWGPAWVDWRSGDGYVGWAPLPPPQPAGHGPVSSYWVFVRLKDLSAANIRPLLLSKERAAAAYESTQPRHETVAPSDDIRWYQGPAIEVVEQAAGSAVVRRKITLPTREWLAAIDVDANEVKVVPKAQTPTIESKQNFALPRGSKYDVLRRDELTPRHVLVPEARRGSTWEPMERLGQQRLWPGAARPQQQGTGSSQQQYQHGRRW